jgi:hypothetical protein
MTEAEWLACTEPDGMLAFLRGKATGRQSRLFACACCRGIWGMLTDPRIRRAVESAEAFADGLIEPDALAVSEEEAEAAISRGPSGEPLDSAAYAAWWTTAAYEDSPGEIADQTARWVEQALVDSLGPSAGDSEPTRQSDLLRDVFGALFRPTASRPEWVTPMVLALAGGIYADRAFDRLPILADALEEAGCMDAEILSHCRGPGPHVRGCWVVDLILGKE